MSVTVVNQKKEIWILSRPDFAEHQGCPELYGLLTTQNATVTHRLHIGISFYLICTG